MENYAKLRNDLSGSMTKNRYRYELYWGISKIYELFLSQKDFSVIFDYASDIDVIQEENFEFYQLKTKNSNLTIAFIKRLSKSGESIISKLASLDTSDFVKCLNIVSNSRFSCEDATLTSREKFSFSQLKETEKQDLLKHLYEILGKESNFEKYYFIRSDICINNSKKILLGETVIFLKSVLKTNMLDPEYFLNYLQGMVMDKATYEKSIESFEEIIEFKGITKTELEKLVEEYKIAFNPYMNEILRKADLLESKTSYSKIVKIKRSIHSFRKLGYESKLILPELKKAQLIILTQNEELDSLEFNEYVNNIIEKANFDNRFDIYDKISFVLIAITNVESWGKNEKIDN